MILHCRPFVCSGSRLLAYQRRLLPIASRLLVCLLVVLSTATLPAQDDPVRRAGNEQVAEIMRSFAPRGVQADDSDPTPPQQALETFNLADGLSIDLVASEPQISQPLFLSWDSRGRMWVVEYRQYQYPAGLKVVRFDQHLRAVFDKVPAPPPNHISGKDRITVLEDADRDGHFELRRTVIDGLNIATSVAIGRGGIWVLNPPYLLFYPDADGDDIPDAAPEVHLSGFGLQDTHSVANSLLWGPDGWLYAANGSTTAGTVTSANTEGVAFQGQCIWRYHPGTKVFEIYAQGGGNTFSVEIDKVGRVFSGHNGGNTRGWYYPQGSYSRKNWGKHGPLTNPYAFGFFEAMPLEGDTRRFAQAFAIYEGGLLPERFDGTILAPNAMQNLVWHSQRLADGSTYRTVDQPNLLSSTDRWFRPVYCGIGPDGAVYLSDWYDTRLSHVSPTDDWHKESGRVYRIRPQGPPPIYQHDDMRLMGDRQLVELFTDKNKWVRRRAGLELGWRYEETNPEAALSPPDDLVRQLSGLVETDASLESLWALNQMGRLSDRRASRWLQHSNEHVRRWMVRLLGDSHRSLPELVVLAGDERSSQVRSQLAASARRLDASVGLAIARELTRYDQDCIDPHLPLMLWWAIESHADDYQQIKQLLSDPEIWGRALVQKFVLGRLSQRYGAIGTPDALAMCAELVRLAPDEASEERIVEGLNAAFQGRTLPELPPALADALGRYRAARGEAGIVLAIRQGQTDQMPTALGLLKDSQTDLGLRIELVAALGEAKFDRAFGEILRLAAGGTTIPALQRVALQTLSHYENSQVASSLVKGFGGAISKEHDLQATGMRTLASRKPWALALMNEIQQWRLKESDVPPDVVQRLRSFEDQEVAAAVEQVFGQVQPIESPERLEEIGRLTKLLRSSSGDSAAGRLHFEKKCAACHRLFGRGATAAPALDNYDRGSLKFWLPAIVAPSLEIREGYQTYVALVDDGRVVTGVIAAQDGRSVTLRTADNQTVRLGRKEIEQLKALETSLMPDNLLGGMTDEEVRDLFAYLSSQPGQIVQQE